MSLLTNPQELTQNLIFAGLIYGQPGIGKSTLALSAPSPVCIDADRGMKRVEPHLRCPSLQVENYAQIIQLLNSDEINSFETLVFDTIGEVLTYMEPYLICQNPKNAKGNGTLSLQGYGERKREFKHLLTLIKNRGKSVVFVAHEKEEKDNDIRIVRPEIAGSSGADIIKMLDFVGYMEAKGSKRTISFYPTEKYYAKNSLQLDEVVSVPDTKDGNIFISEQIIKRTQQRLAEQAELRAEYDELIDTAQGLIENNQEDINKAVELVKDFKIIWDSKRRILTMLSKIAKENGWKFNKTIKLYEQELPKEEAEEKEVMCDAA